MYRFGEEFAGSVEYVAYMEVEVATLFGLIQKYMVAAVVFNETFGSTLTVAFEPLKLAALPISPAPAVALEMVPLWPLAVESLAEKVTPLPTCQKPLQLLSQTPFGFYWLVAEGLP